MIVISFEFIHSRLTVENEIVSAKSLKRNAKMKVIFEKQVGKNCSRKSPESISLRFIT